MQRSLFGLAVLAVAIALPILCLAAPDAALAAVAAGTTLAWVPVVAPSGQTINFPYTHVGMTDAINELPNQFGMIGERNLAPTEPKTSTVVELTIDKGLLYVLSTQERGAPAQAAQKPRAEKIFLEIPHVPEIYTIKPEDIQDMVSLTQGPNAPMTMEEAFNRHLEAARARHDLTLEYFRMGALKGEIYDGDLTLVHNLFAAFNVTKKVIDFELDDPETEVSLKCSELVSYIRANLKGEVMRGGVEAMVSTEFFNKLVTHAKVEKFWLQAEQALALANPSRVERGGQYGRTFAFGNIVWNEYDATASNKAGDPLRFIAEGKGHAFPLGTMSSFRTYLGPANDIRFANTPGRELYASPEVLKHGAGIEVKTESNPLPIWRRPQALVELVMY